MVKMHAQFPFKNTTETQLLIKILADIVDLAGSTRQITIKDGLEIMRHIVVIWHQ